LGAPGTTCSASGKPLWQFAQYDATQTWEISQDTARAGGWQYVVGVRSGGRQYLYVNGTLSDSGVETASGILPRETGNDFTVGRYIQAITAGSNEGFAYFHGLIDEVNVSDVARSAAWIALCYASQKDNQIFVHFK
jgi:hypothetical protein